MEPQAPLDCLRDRGIRLPLPLPTEHRRHHIAKLRGVEVLAGVVRRRSRLVARPAEFLEGSVPNCLIETENQKFDAAIGAPNLPAVPKHKNP